MKKNIIVIFYLFIVSSTLGQVALDFANVPDHPRLLLLEGEEEKIKKLVKTHTEWNKLHRAIIQESTTMLAVDPLTRNQIGRRILQTSREAFRRIFYLSYSWRMTNDRRFLERAERELLAVSQFADWNPSHFLDVAEMTIATAIGYDWLYNELPSSSRDLIAQAIIDKGMRYGQDDQYTGWRRAKNNWNQVCNTGLAFGALAVLENQPTASKNIISLAISSIKIPMSAYAPEGNYTEGYSYWAYGTSFNVLFISMLEKAFGHDFGLVAQEGFLQTASFYANLVGTSGRPFNYGDAGGIEGLQPAMFWFANKLKDPNVLYVEKGFLDRSKFNEKTNRLLPAAMLWAAGIDMASIQPPSTKLWHGQSENEVAVLRTGWDRENDIYVGFKGGTASVSHGHMDAGSFVIDMDGVRWACDLGMQQYNSLESAGLKIWDMVQNSPRWGVFRLNNFSHNTLTVNGHLHNMDGNAKLLKKSDHDRRISAVFDLSTVLDEDLAKAERGIAIVDNRIVTVRDELVGGEEEVTVRWTMLTPARVNKIEGNRLLLKNGEKTMLVLLNGLDTVGWKSWEAEPPQDYDAPNPGVRFVGFEFKLKPQEKGTFQVTFTTDGEEGHTIPVIPLWQW